MPTPYLYFQTRRVGTIINIASRAAFRGDDPTYLHYAASKDAIVALTRSIARGFAADNILAFTVAPGFVSTEMSNQFIQEFGEADIIRDIPGKIALPQDVANVIAFLAAGLATHATGTAIDINGASYVHGDNYCKIPLKAHADIFSNQLIYHFSKTLKTS
ncbi:SDR family NAD(P)-dependent oxidoreductase [Oscillatoria nigro-viridis]|uniref:SDR family NAD(P)-dependent oxidoreductase n=1 Tax=Phormidium nigroviride TaxID=482564 RepID=UPI0002D60899|nr:SDR family oxidoreductase [Oscillatoria nigro-viridis]